MAEKSHTVTFLSAPSGSPTDVVRVDDVELSKGQSVSGLTDDQVTRLQALPGLRFKVDERAEEAELEELDRKHLDERAEEAGVPDPMDVTDDQNPQSKER